MPEPKAEEKLTEDLKYRKQKGREICRSMSMSHPPVEDLDTKEEEMKPEKKFYSLGRYQDKEQFSKYNTNEGRTAESSDPTDLRNLHCPEPPRSRVQHTPAEPRRDLQAEITFHESELFSPQPEFGNHQTIYQQRQRHQSQSSPPLAPDDSRSHLPLVDPRGEPLYAESKKLNNRHLELISQLLNPENREQAQQIQILSQLLQSDLSRYKNLYPDNESDGCQDGSRAQSQQSERSDTTFHPSQGSEPPRGYIKPQLNHSPHCELTRHPPQIDLGRKYPSPQTEPNRSGNIDLERSSIQQSDLIQKLLQADLSPTKYSKSELLEQLLGFDPTKGSSCLKDGSDSSPNQCRTLQLGSRSSNSLSRNQEQILGYDDRRRTVKEKGDGCVHP